MNKLSRFDDLLRSIKSPFKCKKRTLTPLFNTHLATSFFLLIWFFFSFLISNVSCGITAQLTHCYLVHHVSQYAHFIWFSGDMNRTNTMKRSKSSIHTITSHHVQRNAEIERQRYETEIYVEGRLFERNEPKNFYFFLLFLSWQRRKRKKKDWQKHHANEPNCKPNSLFLFSLVDVLLVKFSHANRQNYKR